MKSLAIVLAILMAGCAATYQQPKAIAPEASLPFLTSKGDIFKAARQVLVAEGYQITEADEASGTISTASRFLRLTPAQADCGTTMGLDYLKDNRTSTRVAFGIIVKEGELTVRAHIEGEYRPGDVVQDITLSCVSRGSLEKSLMEKIVKAAGSK